MIGFAQPLWLPLTVVTLFLFTAVLVYAEVKRREMLATLASRKLLAALTSSISGARRRLKQVLLLSAVFCLGLALARPQMGYRWEEVRRKGVDILFAIDTSRSMLAQDVRPSRLERSKLAVIDFSRNFSGGRLGLVPFAGSAFLMCPLTLDTEAFYESLESLDTEVIGRPGTDIGSAIREASQAFTQGSGGEKILILITDGEDLEGDAVEAAKEVKEQGVKIYAVGVGTAAGDLIPDFQKQSGVTFIKDEAGNLVKSRLDEKVLREMATLTGGRYYPLGTKGEGLEAILRDNQHLMKELETKENMRKVPLEQFQWPLLAGLILLLAEILIRETKTIEKKSSGSFLTYKWASKKVVTLLFFTILGLTHYSQASVRDAEKSMRKGQYPVAVKQYQEALEKEPMEAALLYNKGVAAYRAKEYEEAEKAFEESKKSRDLKIQEKAYYNLGNTRFRAGELTEQNNREATIRKWETALESYQGAMALNQENQDARFNHDLVKKRLEELKKNPPPPPQNKDQKQDQNNSDKKDQKDSENQNQSNSKQAPDQTQKAQDSGKKESSNEDKKTSPPEPSTENQKAEKESAKADPDKKKEAEKPQEKSPLDQEKEAGKEQDSSGKAEPMQPGQMSKEEAKALLNAAKGSQKQLLLPITRTKDSDKNNSVQKNW
jgi:Ca-activated chloride channel homolog